MSENESSLSRRDFGLCAGGLLALLGASGADAVLNRGLHDPAAVKAAVARLSSVPDRIGSWVSIPESIDDREKRTAGIAGRVRRTYRNSENGYVVSMTILCGASGPMSVHPPTACFDSVGYELSSGPLVVVFADHEGSQSTLNRASFRLPGSPLSEVVRVFWGWSDNGMWTTPANPRSAFRSQPFLYKLYVVDRALLQSDHPLQTENFLEDALPAIRNGVQSR